MSGPAPSNTPLRGVLWQPGCAGWEALTGVLLSPSCRGSGCFWLLSKFVFRFK